MDIFRQHELFEIEVLEKINSAKLLDPLIFGGGTMLRLCHELNRYSVDLDFWLMPKVSRETYFHDLRNMLAENYEITDAEIKYYTLLFELRSGQYPKRLKIEIRKTHDPADYQKSIAFSKFSTKQVLVNAHTLQQTMENKISAFLDRNEIRDCFDIEFLIRRGIDLPAGSTRKLEQIRKKVGQFKDVDFRVKLGSILEQDIRNYYIENRFRFLEGKLASAISPQKLK